METRPVYWCSPTIYSVGASLTHVVTYSGASVSSTRSSSFRYSFQSSAWRWDTSTGKTPPHSIPDTHTHHYHHTHTHSPGFVTGGCTGISRPELKMSSWSEDGWWGCVGVLVEVGGGEVILLPHFCAWSCITRITRSWQWLVCVVWAVCMVCVSHTKAALWDTLFEATWSKGY